MFKAKRDQTQKNADDHETVIPSAKHIFRFGFFNDVIDTSSHRIPSFLPDSLSF